MNIEPYLPPGRTRIEKNLFQFNCHPDVSCYLTCCRNVDMLLFPYDIIMLKQRLNLHSSDFLKKYTVLCEGSHDYFPGLKLKLADDESRSCFFLNDKGCTVYLDRPSACRTYPLERGVEFFEEGSPLKIHYFMTHHPYCLGHSEQRTYSIVQWERDQKLHECNMYNDLWAELDAFFATNPWAGEGKAGPYQKLAFMVCYDIDDFRTYVEQNRILNGFRLAKDERQRIARSDASLLQFGFNWLEFILGGKKKLIKK